MLNDLSPPSPVARAVIISKNSPTCPSFALPGKNIDSHLIRVFLVDFILDCDGAGFREIFRRDLNQIGYCRLDGTG